MEDFKNLPEEFTLPLIKCFDILSKCNIVIFDENRTFIQKNWHFLIVFPCIFIYYLTQTLNLIMMFKGELELLDLANVVPVYVVCTQTILKAAIVTLNKVDIRAITLQLGSMWRTVDLNEKQIIKKNVLLKRLNFCYSVFYWTNILGSWQYLLAPLLETLFRKYILQQECELLLPISCRFPFDPTETWTRYVLIYIFEIYSMFRIIYYYIGSELTMLTLCAHLSTQFALLKEDLLNIQPELRKNTACYNNDDVEFYFDDTVGINDFIITHQKLLKLAQQLNDIFNKMIFVNLSSATISICFFGFSATAARGNVEMANNFIGSMASILPIFTLCYYGEMLMQESGGITETAYENLWYKGNIDYQKKIWFIIRRSQRRCCLTSLRYVPITLNTFTTVMSTTWSYFSLASSVYDEKN